MGLGNNVVDELNEGRRCRDVHECCYSVVRIGDVGFETTVVAGGLMPPR